jgi:hypothetical protein
MGKEVDVAKGIGEVRRVGGGGRRWRTREGKLCEGISIGNGEGGGVVLIL